MPRAGQPGLEAGPCRADFVVIRAALKRPAGRVGNLPGVGAVSLPGPEGPSQGLAWRGGAWLFPGMGRALPWCGAAATLAKPPQPTSTSGWTREDRLVPEQAHLASLSPQGPMVPSVTHQVISTTASRHLYWGPHVPL